MAKFVVKATKTFRSHLKTTSRSNILNLLIRQIVLDKVDDDEQGPRNAKVHNSLTEDGVSMPILPAGKKAVALPKSPARLAKIEVIRMKSCLPYTCAWRTTPYLLYSVSVVSGLFSGWHCYRGVDQGQVRLIPPGSSCSERRDVQ